MSLADQAPFTRAKITKHSDSSVIYLDDDISAVSNKQDIDLVKSLRLVLLNYDEEYSRGSANEINNGDQIISYLGYLPEDSLDKTFGGIIYNVIYEEDHVVIEALDWAAYLIGAVITGIWIDKDVGTIIKDIIDQQAPMLDTSKLTEIDYVFSGEYRRTYSDVMESVLELAAYADYKFYVDADKYCYLVPKDKQYRHSENWDTDYGEFNVQTAFGGSFTLIDGHLKGEASASTGAQIRWENTTPTPIQTDIIVQTKINFSQGDSGGIFARISTSDDDEFYFLDVNYGSNTISIVKSTQSGGQSTLASSGTSINLTNDTWYWIKFYTVGEDLKGKIWAVGGSEPDAWDVSTTDSTHSSGLVGLGILYNSTTCTVYWDDTQIWAPSEHDINEDDIITDNISYSRENVASECIIIGSNIKWEDNFTTDEERREWDFTSMANHTQEDNVLTISGSNSDYSNILVNTLRDTDSSLTIKCTPRSGLDYFKIAIRYDSASDTYYALECRIGDSEPKFVLLKTVNGEETHAETIYNPSPSIDTEYMMKISCSGSNITAQVNDGDAYTVYDEDVAVRGTYAIMLYGSGNELEISYVKIESERIAIGTAVDDTYSYFGNKKIIKKMPSIRTVQEAENRASLELNLAIIEQTNSRITIHGDENISIGDVINLSIPSKGIDGTYVVFSVEHTYDDDDFTTVLSISERRKEADDAIIFLLRQRLKDAVSLMESIDLIKKLSDDIDLFGDQETLTTKTPPYKWDAADSKWNLWEFI